MDQQLKLNICLFENTIKIKQRQKLQILYVIQKKKMWIASLHIIILYKKFYLGRFST